MINKTNERTNRTKAAAKQALPSAKEQTETLVETIVSAGKVSRAAGASSPICESGAGVKPPICSFALGNGVSPPEGRNALKQLRKMGLKPPDDIDIKKAVGHDR